MKNIREFRFMRKYKHPHQAVICIDDEGNIIAAGRSVVELSKQLPQFDRSAVWYWRGLKATDKFAVEIDGRLYLFYRVIV